MTWPFIYARHKALQKRAEALEKAVADLDKALVAATTMTVYTEDRRRLDAYYRVGLYGDTEAICTKLSWREAVKMLADHVGVEFKYIPPLRTQAELTLTVKEKIK